MTDNIAISVLMPVHNGMSYLPETVASVLTQSFQAFEFLAIDDGSTDGTADYLRSLKDPRVRYHRLEKVGLVGALNYGIEQSRASIIARIDADDVAHPERLARQHLYMLQHPECVLLGSDFVEIDSEGRLTVAHEPLITTDIAIRWQMQFETSFLHPCVVFRKDAARQVGGYRTKYDVAEDYDMWVRIARFGQLANLSDILMKKRVHPSAVSVVHNQRGWTQSSDIAAEYARILGREHDSAIAGEMYWFYNFGRIPERCSMPQLVAGFHAATRMFSAADNGNSPELTKAIRAVQTKLRWICLQKLKWEWFQPKQALQWIRAMKGFDPETNWLQYISSRIRGKLDRLFGITQTGRTRYQSSWETE